MWKKRSVQHSQSKQIHADRNISVCIQNLIEANYFREQTVLKIKVAIEIYILIHIYLIHVLQIQCKLSSLISTFFQGSEVANQILIPIYLVYVFEIQGQQGSQTDLFHFNQIWCSKYQGSEVANQFQIKANSL